MVLRHFSSLLCCQALKILLLWGTCWQAQPWACAGEVQSIPRQIFKEKGAWKGNEHTTPNSSWQGVQSRVAWGRLKALPLPQVREGFIFLCCRCCCSFLLLRKRKQSGEEADGWTDWQRGNCAKPSLCSTVQTPQSQTLQTDTSLPPAHPAGVTSPTEASPERHSFQVPRICLNPLVFQTSEFPAISPHIKPCWVLSFPHLIILNSELKIWTLLKELRLMLLCSTSCLKK